MTLVAGFEALLQVTSDCQPWRRGGKLAVCGACGGAQKVLDDDWHAQVAQIYRAYRIYHQSGGTEQAVFDQQSGAAQSRSGKLVAMLAGGAEALPRRGRLLDVGCGNGAFLRAFAARFPGWTLAGSEINDKYKAQVERMPGVEAMHVAAPQQIAGRFDLVTLIHVLEHVPQPVRFVAALRQRVAADGRLLVEVPDHGSNPFDLLIADHSAHFSAGVLRGVMRRAGWAVEQCGGGWVDKELTALGRGDGGSCGDEGGWSAKPQAGDGGELVVAKVCWLTALLEQARAGAGRGALGLFGTSIGATWLAAELGDAVTCFVDEDPARVGAMYCGKPVYRPAEAPAGLPVLVALPTWLARRVAERLRDAPARWVLPAAEV
ncbi:MAG: class I SAM-dependent methyltransferase [Phycisphaeraceae bacterium]